MLNRIDGEDRGLGVGGRGDLPVDTVNVPSPIPANNSKGSSNPICSLPDMFDQLLNCSSADEFMECARWWLEDSIDPPAFKFFLKNVCIAYERNPDVQFT